MKIIVIGSRAYNELVGRIEKIEAAIVKCTPNIGRISICLDGMSSVLYRAHVV